jgi:hypothetical protein
MRIEKAVSDEHFQDNATNTEDISLVSAVTRRQQALWGEESRRTTKIGQLACSILKKRAQPKVANLK